MRILEEKEMVKIQAGELITLTAVMACLVAALIAVICYRLFMSKKGSTTLPGGFKFTWE